MSTLNGPGEGTWSVFAEKVVEERDRLRGVCDLRLHIMERLEKERDEALADVKTWKRDWYVAKADLGTAIRLADVALRDVAEKYERALRERDEARAQLAAALEDKP